MGQTVIVARGALLFGNKADFDDYNDNWRDGIEERDGHESQGRDICQIFRGHGRRPRQATARARGADCRIYMVEVYAILDAKGCVVPCSEQRWRSWYFRRGQKPSLIKRQLLGNYLIETCFYSQVHVLEGEEPNFWRVRLTKPHENRAARPSGHPASPARRCARSPEEGPLGRSLPLLQDFLPG